MGARLQSKRVGCSELVSKTFSNGVASIGNKITVFLKQRIEIRLLVTAAGVGVLCGNSKADLTTCPAFEDLLDAGQGITEGSVLRRTANRRKAFCYPPLCGERVVNDKQVVTPADRPRRRNTARTESSTR